MNCGEFRRCADALVDGELEPPAAEKARAHVDGCVDCQRWVKIVKRTTEVFRRNVVKPDAPHELKTRIRGQLGG